MKSVEKDFLNLQYNTVLIALQINIVNGQMYL